MPSYFFHIAFDLTPAADSTSQSTKLDYPVWTPTRHTNIFSSKLPAHQIRDWRTLHVTTPPLQHASTSAQTNWHSLETQLTLQDQESRDTVRSGDRCDKALQAVDDQASLPLGTAVNDWRVDRISIESVDMETRVSDRYRTTANNNDPSDIDALSGTNGSATKGVYVPTNPTNTEVGYGIVRLYRDTHETPGLDHDASKTTGSKSQRSARNVAAVSDEAECSTLCILAVPAYMSPSDFLGFVGEKTRQEVSHFRLIRSERANKYMVLMKFREPRKAADWRKEWNGKLFNGMEPENCHVVFVKSIEFRTSTHDNEPSSYPSMADDPFTPSAGVQAPSSLTSGPSSSDAASLASSLTTKPLAPPTPSLVELPTCPVCLERMDESTGLLTILCQHVFHCACLQKWKGSGCPVCRYTQDVSLAGHGAFGEGKVQESACMVCGSDSSLWICLICGHIGCGRYDDAHAYAHWEATSHSFAMDIATQHVWDYAGDGYVHRLIQNKADGQLFDLPAAFHEHRDQLSMTAYGPDTVPREKLDAMSAEYTYLLTSQLDSQRAYFEEQMDRAADKTKAATAEASAATSTMEKLIAKIDILTTDQRASSESIRVLERDVKRLSQQAEKKDELARKFGKDWQEEKTINQSLMTRIEHLDKRIEEVKAQNEKLKGEKMELEEQNRDLGFFISGGAKLQAAGLGEEVTEGTIEVGEAPQEKGRKRKGKKK